MDNLRTKVLVGGIGVALTLIAGFALLVLRDSLALDRAEDAASDAALDRSCQVYRVTVESLDTELVEKFRELLGSSGASGANSVAVNSRRLARFLATAALRPRLPADAFETFDAALSLLAEAERKSIEPTPLDNGVADDLEAALSDVRSLCGDPTTQG